MSRCVNQYMCIICYFPLLSQYTILSCNRRNKNKNSDDVPHGIIPILWVSTVGECCGAVFLLCSEIFDSFIYLFSCCSIYVLLATLLLQYVRHVHAINGKYSTGTHPEGGGIMGSTYFYLLLQKSGLITILISSSNIISL